MSSDMDLDSDGSFSSKGLQEEEVSDSSSYHPADDTFLEEDEEMGEEDTQQGEQEEE